MTYHDVTLVLNVQVEGMTKYLSGVSEMTFTHGLFADSSPTAQPELREELWSAIDGLLCKIEKQYPRPTSTDLTNDAS